MAYRLERTVRLAANGRGFTIERRLTNLGREPLSTVHFAHNFIRLGGRGVDETAVLRFAGPLTLAHGKAPPAWQVDVAGVVRLAAPLRPGSAAFATVAGDELPRAVEVRTAHAPFALRFETSREPTRVALSARAEAICPESFVTLTLALGASVAWTDTWTVVLGTHFPLVPEVKAPNGKLMTPANAE